MSEKPAKLNFQDLPFLKLAAGFLLLVLTSTIIASGSLVGPSSRIEREPEIFEVTPPTDLGGDFQYKRSITLDNPSSEEAEVEVLLTIPTDNLVTEGKMQSSCNDMRFTDGSGAVLNYWIESGCNTAATQVWVELRELIAAGGAATIYMYYGDPSASSKELAWDQDSPKLVLPFSSGCPTGWEPVAELNQGRFARGSTTYGDTGGGGEHRHHLTATLEPENSSAGSRSAKAHETPRGHTHQFEVDTYSTEITPPFVETTFCQLSLGADKRLPNQIPAKGIAFFTSLPDTASWSREAGFDGRFLKGGGAPGTTGGSSTHQHQVEGRSPYYNATSGDSGGDTSSSGDCSRTHSHPIEGDTDVKEVLPPYLSVFVASSDGDSLLPQDAVVASNFTSVPPLGWKQFTGLNDRFPRGSGIYGGVGGSEVHQHTTSFITERAWNVARGACDGECKRNRCSRYDHRHEVAGTTDDQSSLPKYFDVIYVQKKVDILTETYNDDETPVTPGPAECESATDCDLPNLAGWAACNYVECVSNSCVYSQKSNGIVCQTATGESGQCEAGQCQAGEPPIEGNVELTVKFEGVSSTPVNNANQTVKIWGESLDGSVVLATKALPLSVPFSVDSEGTGFYHGALNLTEAQLDKHYRLVIKGPRHLGREFVDIVLSEDGLELTGPGQELLPGDLNQDGLVDEVDVGIVNDNTGGSPNDAGDLNYDSYTDATDKSLILETLSFRQDPR